MLRDRVGTNMGLRIIHHSIQKVIELLDKGEVQEAQKILKKICKSLEICGYNEEGLEDIC